MDNAATQAITKALDASIADVAGRQFAKLQRGRSRQQIATAIHRSLDSLRLLQRGIMPCYDEWDALFYAVWYQQSQINLAHKLFRKVPEDRNPLRSGSGSLQVVDFGCGALAVQFGLALAAADTWQEHRTVPEIRIISNDASKSMVQIGWELWNRFIDEIADEAEYPALGALRRACAEIEFDDLGKPSATCWLTVFHVAYEENCAEVKKDLDTHVEDENPDLVFVTSHPSSWPQWTYSPVPYGYSDISDVFCGADFAFEGKFEATTKFRTCLYDSNIGNISRLLAPDKDWLVRNYLKSRPSVWKTIDFKTQDSLYTRDRLSNDD